jgi:uncharacterized protein YprB with RNaseH-like and TPR domain
MITLQSKTNIIASYPLQHPYNWEEIVFFDIETTGLSTNTSFLYLIGCMYFNKDSWHLIQWIADDMNSESTILSAFSIFINTYKRIVHFNGTGFDIPYISKKCKHFNLQNPFDNIESFDIYRKITPYKKLLPLPNYKLKTIEQFLGLRREDVFSGEELIQIYANYLGKLQYEKLHEKRLVNHKLTSTSNKVIDVEKSNNPASTGTSSNDLLEILLLHNSEDVKGLLQVATILYYTDLFEMDFHKADSFDKERYKENDSLSDEQSGLTISYDENYSTITYDLPFTLPNPVSWWTPLPCTYNKNTIKPDVLNEEIKLNLTIIESQLTLRIPIFCGELKYFYDDYANYFYLPKEDMAIHKSVAGYVDKEFRVKAKPSTSYTKKSGCFLPQVQSIIAPQFKNDYSEKVSYFEISNPSFNQSVVHNMYLVSLLHYIFNCRDSKNA